jgi:diadenosine tetraphosphate (Ap4A) HIT family hydrolase
MSSDNECPFCRGNRLPLAENLFSFTIENKYPVSPGHCLVIPKVHVPTIFELPPDAYEGCFDLVRVVKDLLLSKYRPDGFNIGTNCGEPAGQTVMHAHLHVIPRYTGDVPNPRGGVRHVIPEK